MRLRILFAAVLGLVLMSCAFAQENSYLDIYSVKVKPEKRAEFEAAVKKMIAANRGGGDRWMAAEVAYGEQGQVFFISTRSSFADVEKGMQSFEEALGKALGPAGAQKLFADFSSTVSSSRAEVRARRWDLSTNAPSNDEGRMRVVAESKLYRTIAVRVRPGRAQQFEELVKQVKRAHESNGSKPVVFASQSALGSQGGWYYLSTLGDSLAMLDGIPSLSKLLGEKAYREWQKGGAETVLTTETWVARFNPELSNPPDEVVKMGSSFWKPKASMKAAKPAAAKPAAAAPAAKKQ